MHTTQTTDRWLQVLLFIAAFGLTLAATSLTLAPGVGAGSAAAWAAGSFGIGSSDSAVYSPLFLILTKIVRWLGPENSTAERLNFFSSIGVATAAGLVSLLLFPFMKRRGYWGVFSLALLGGVLTGITRVGWASALMINPGPWAIAAMLGAFLLVGSGEADNRRITFGFFVMGLAGAFHVATLVFFPAFLYWGFMHSTQWRGQQAFIQMAALCAPLCLMLIPNAQPFFATTGLFTGTPGLPDAQGFGLVGWTALWTLTPAGLLLALWGYFRLPSDKKQFLLLAGLVLAGIVILTLLKTETAQLAAIVLSVIIAIGAIFGLADLFNRIPGGPALLLWILVPGLWVGHGLAVSQASADERTIWEIHNSNLIRTVRLNNLIITEDDSLTLAPYFYLVQAKKMRPDLALINPAMMSDPGYLEFIEATYPHRFKAIQPTLDSLKASLQQDENDPAVRGIVESLLAELIVSEIKSTGVVLSPGVIEEIERGDSTAYPVLFKLMTQDYQVVPEGLFYRVLPKEDRPFPFHFSGLDMARIKFDNAAPMLQNRMVTIYPKMFTNRGSWMLSRKFTAEGMEYVRWALKIAPDYTPAVLLARDYGISGEPTLLGK